LDNSELDAALKIFLEIFGGKSLADRVRASGFNQVRVNAARFIAESVAQCSSRLANRVGNGRSAQ
jgi:hypothetical protein